MMLDIFSSFDPGCNSLHTVSPILLWTTPTMIFMLFSSLWATPPHSTIMLSLPINLITHQATSTFSTHLKSMTSIISALFSTLIFINTLSLMPYIFNSSSHIALAFPVASCLWLTFIISSMTNNLSSFMAKLIPSGAPGWLNSFLLNVETLSILVRPITLSFRLTANMSTGHIVLSLMTIYLIMSLFSSHYYTTLPLLLTTMFYTIFEMGICLMQAYIFCLLLTLYSNEHSLSAGAKSAVWFRPKPMGPTPPPAKLKYYPCITKV